MLSASIPITLSREMIITHSGDKEVMKVSVHNPTSIAWTTAPDIDCGTEFPVDDSANSRTIDPGKSATFNVLLTIPTSSPDTHLCQMSMGDYTKDMAIKVIE